jgi:hypothetical protein
VRIGRIDVRASTPVSAPPRARSERARPAVSLDDYLKRRGGKP